VQFPKKTICKARGKPTRLEAQCALRKIHKACWSMLGWQRQGNKNFEIKFPENRKLKTEMGKQKTETETEN
jgi:hypothetical protein